MRPFYYSDPMGKDFDRVALVVMDGVGCGEAEDAHAEYPQDTGANSLVNASRFQRIHAPALQNIGLEYIPGLQGKISVALPTLWANVRGALGALSPTFAGNGSPEGHQALTGHRVATPYLLFNKTGFPPELVNRIEEAAEKAAGRPVRVIRYPGTDDINGEKFFNHPAIGEVHYSSKDPKNPLFVPIYASSDSLVQVALHVDVMPLSMMEAICQAIRTEALDGEFKNVARVILRPWGGEPGKFERLSQHRKDFGIDPDGPTIVDHMASKGMPVFAVGKAGEMLNGRGFDHDRIMKGDSDKARIEEVARLMGEGQGPAFIFANLKDTDEKSGHTRKPSLYSQHVETASRGIGEVMGRMGERDLLIVTADHGTDPTNTAHTNHTRENVPLLVFTPGLVRPVELGIRSTYADVAATIAEAMGIEQHVHEGTSFLKEVLDGRRPK